MALKFRRGTTAQQSGSLAFGEPYVNTTLGTLLIGGQSGDIVLSAGGTGSTGNFGAISGSGLDITGNANIAGNLTLGGAITIGDASADTVNVVASLSSSLIPQTTNAFDLGSADKIWRDLYISTGSIKFVEGNSVVKSLSAATLTALEVATGSSNASVSALNSFSSSQLTQNTTLATYTGSVNTRLTEIGVVSGSLITSASAAKTTNDSQGVSITNLNSATASLLIETANLETFSGSVLTRLIEIGVVSGSLITSASAAKTTNDSQGVSITNLNTTTASLLIETANLETFSGSALTRLTALEVETANLESFSSSALTRLSNLEGTDITITLTGDVTGTGTITNLGNVSFATTVAANQVALGTDTTGDYVASLVQGTGVTITNNSGEGATPTIAIGQAVATSSNVQFNSLGVGMAASATAGRIDATNDVVAFSSSDIRFKENIKPIENAIDKIRKISGNTYDWKEENKVEHGYEGNDVGVIAQEIEAVLPQLVQTRESGFKAVKYDKLVALLIEGIKEQQLQIEQLRIDLNNCRNNKGL